VLDSFVQHFIGKYTTNYPVKDYTNKNIAIFTMSLVKKKSFIILHLLQEIRI